MGLCHFGDIVPCESWFVLVIFSGPWSREMAWSTAVWPPSRIATRKHEPFDFHVRSRTWWEWMIRKSLPHSRPLSNSLTTWKVARAHSHMVIHCGCRVLRFGELPKHWTCHLFEAMGVWNQILTVLISFQMLRSLDWCLWFQDWHVRSIKPSSKVQA